jgi:peptidoglycan hydrolase-like protein with peptidoglycan-binding domain
VRLLFALVAAADVGTVQAQNAAEVTFWNRVRDATSPDELKAYLEAYPNGAFAETARARLKELAPISLRPQMPSAPGKALAEAAVIREVQERLYNLNYDIGVLNGHLTEETRNAIREWQKDVQHEPTGELSEEELDQLRHAKLPTAWGALAYAARGASAVVWSRPSRQEAVSAALADCHARAGRDNCKVVTAAATGCGALGFYVGTVRRTTFWGAYAIVRPTLGQAMDLALSECRELAKTPEACGIRLTFCADGSHKQ